MNFEDLKKLKKEDTFWYVNDKYFVFEAHIIENSNTFFRFGNRYFEESIDARIKHIWGDIDREETIYKTVTGHRLFSTKKEAIVFAIKEIKSHLMTLEYDLKELENEK